MPDAITNTSPVLYLYRIGALDILPRLFDQVWIPNAAVFELKEGQQRGYDVPDLVNYSWLHVVDPRLMPSEWLALDLGAGERRRQVYKFGERSKSCLKPSRVD